MLARGARRMLAGLGIVAGAAWGVLRYAPTPAERTGAKERAPGSGLRSLAARSDDGDVARRMQERLAVPSPSAWAELVSLDQFVPP